MTRPAIAEPCAFPGDLSLTDGVDVIRWEAGRIFVNGYADIFEKPGSLSLEWLARDVLNVVLDPVPEHLITPFVEIVAHRGSSWVMLSSAVKAWIYYRTACRVEGGRLVVVEGGR